MEEKCPSPARLWLKNPVTFFTPLLAFALFLGLAPCDALLCDLASHFMAQYALAAAGLLALAFLFRLSPRWKVFLAALLLLAGWQLLAFIPSHTPPAPKTTLKILQANVLFLNIDPLPLKRLIAAERPDIVATVETPPEFAHMMSALKKDYPYQSLHPQGDNPRGIAIISRRPLRRRRSPLSTTAAYPRRNLRLRWRAKRFPSSPYIPLRPSRIWRGATMNSG